jgi:hypothetical protein
MNTVVKVRLFTYKSFRHYGGREITTTPHICEALFIADQKHTQVVELLADCAGFKKGHKIAVNNKDFDIK